MANQYVNDPSFMNDRPMIPSAKETLQNQAKESQIQKQTQKNNSIKGKAWGDMLQRHGGQPMSKWLA